MVLDGDLLCRHNYLICPNMIYGLNSSWFAQLQQSQTERLRDRNTHPFSWRPAEKFVSVSTLEKVLTIA